MLEELEISNKGCLNICECYKLLLYRFGHIYYVAIPQPSFLQSALNVELILLPQLVIKATPNFTCLNMDSVPFNE